MTHALTTTTNAPDAAAIEAVVIGGDLSKLTPPQRVNYYIQVCDSLGLNWRTRPLEYIVLNNKLTLYARKDCADQLRKLHRISIEKPDIQFQDEWIVVSVLARDANGRTDADTGVVNKKDMRGDFGNALMKAVTKAKRRVTLSICGLGMSDETEVETIPTARPVAVDLTTGEIVNAPAPVQSVAPPAVVPTNGNGLHVTDVEVKEGVNETTKKPWTLYIVHFSDGKSASTFDKALADLAHECREDGSTVDTMTHPGKKAGTTVLEEIRRIVPIDALPPIEADTDSPF